MVEGIFKVFINTFLLPVEINKQYGGDFITFLMCKNGGGTFRGQKNKQHYILCLFIN
jgi:hypothetical protein